VNRTPDGRCIRAVTFDAGGTLLEPWPSVGVVYAEAARTAGFGDFVPLELEARFRAAWQVRGAFDYSVGAWGNLVRQTFLGLTPEAGNPKLLAALWKCFAAPSAWRVFPDVLPSLTALRGRGLRLAVVSNWDERLPPLLAAIGLADFFEFILPSIAAPATKPDPRIFAMAALKLQLPPSAILHVGDSQPEDVAGAQGAGFGALLLDRRATGRNSAVLGSLAELASRVEPV
jgi:putative hydrolase of the HAD superfamily